ncbi:GNAT family N-acetyltransferase [Arthrobacter sp. CP30]
MSVSPVTDAAEATDAAYGSPSMCPQTTDLANPADLADPAPTSGATRAAHAPDPACVAEEVIGSVVALTVAASAQAGTSSESPDDDLHGVDGVDGVDGIASSSDRIEGLSDSELEGWSRPASEAPDVIPFHLGEASDRQLRRWSNDLFKQLNRDSPSFMIVDDYTRVIEEIERRDADAASSANPPEFRQKFRDNALGRRFELFRDGVLAGYIAYSMRAGVLRLKRTVVSEPFEHQGVEGILIHQVLLTAHRRRLAAIAYCQKAQDFLQLNPQYKQLVHT